MTEESSSHDLHRLTAMTWDASIPIAFTVKVPGVPQTGYFLVPKMIPVHPCSKPMFEQLHSVDPGFGSDKFSFTAIIPWSVPIGIVVDWLTALEFPNEIKADAKDPIDKMFEDSALPLELKYCTSDQKADDLPVEALLQSNFLMVDKQFAQKLWVASLLGSTNEAVKLPPAVERSLKSWDPHTFFRGRRDMVRKAGDRTSHALCAFHVVQPIKSRQNAPISMITTLRLVEVGTDKMSTFGQLLKAHIFHQYSKLSHDQCLSTEPLASDLGMVRVLGMNPPLYTPLQFLRDHLCARDFALHIVVRPLENTAPVQYVSSPTASTHTNNNTNDTPVNNNSNGGAGNSALPLVADSSFSFDKRNNIAANNNSESNMLLFCSANTHNSNNAHSKPRLHLDDSPKQDSTLTTTTTGLAAVGEQEVNPNADPNKPSADPNL
jgi:hypothetical protein